MADQLYEVYDLHFGLSVACGPLVRSVTTLQVLRVYPKIGLGESKHLESSESFWKQVFEAVDIPVVKEKQLLSHQGRMLQHCSAKVVPIANFLANVHLSGPGQFYITEQSSHEKLKNLGSKSTSMFVISEDMPQSSERSMIYREVETVMVLLQSMNSFIKFFQNRVVLVVSHSHFYSFVSQALNIQRPNDYFEIVSQLGKYESKRSGWSPSIVNLVKGCSHSLNFLGALCNLDRYEITDFKRRLQTVFTNFQRGVSQKSSANQHLENAAGLLKVIFAYLDQFDELIKKLEPLIPNLQVLYSVSQKMPPNQFTNRLWHFHSGIAFSLFAGREKSESRKVNQSMSEVEIAYGGRFDNLVESYRLSRRAPTFACGFITKVHAIMDFIFQAVELTDFELKEDSDPRKLSSVDVCSYESKTCKQKFEMAYRLWKAGVKTEVIPLPLTQKQDKDKAIFTDMKKRGIGFAAIVSSGLDTVDKVRIRSFKSHKEPEYPLKEAISFLCGSIEGETIERKCNKSILEKLLNKLP